MGALASADVTVSRDRERNVRRESARRFGLAPLIAMLLAGFLIRLAFIQSAGYRDDMTIFYQWFGSIAALPPGQVYAHTTPDLNYPPAYILLTELSAFVLRWFVPGTPGEAALNVALKLPAILFDIAGAALAFAIVRREAGYAFALAAAAFIALNPALIYDSAYWGQDDSIPAVLALFAIAALRSDRPVAAWVTLTFAVLVKPPVLVLVPLLLLYPLTVPRRRRRLVAWQTGAGITAALALSEVLALTFFPHPTPLAALRNLVGQLVGGSSYFPFNSLNSFNLWAIFQPFYVSDRTHYCGLSMHLWADLLFTVTAAVIFWQYVRSRASTALFEASAIVLLAFFVLLTEMHERYLLYAVVFLAVLPFKRPYRIAGLILSLTLLLNLEYGLTFMYLDDARATMIDRYEFAPWLVHLCSLANVGILLVLLAGGCEPLRALGRSEWLRAALPPDWADRAEPRNVG